MEGGRRQSHAYVEFIARREQEIESLPRNIAPEAAPSSDGRNSTDLNIVEPTPTRYRRRRYNSLAELFEDFERDRVARSISRRSIDPHAAAGDRINFSDLSIGETSSNQQNQRNPMTHGETVMEQRMTNTSNANLGSNQPIPVGMWVQDNRVSTTVNQRNFSGWNIGGIASNQNNPGIQMRHIEPVITSGMPTSSSANHGASQLPVSLWVEDNRDVTAPSFVQNIGDDDYYRMVGRDVVCRCNNGRQGIAGCVYHQAHDENEIEQVPSENERLSSNKRKAPEEFSINPSYRASSSGSQLPENAWRMASGSHNPSGSFSVPPLVTSMFQHNTPGILDTISGLGIGGTISDMHQSLHSAAEHIENAYRNIRLRTSPAYQQDFASRNMPEARSLTIGQPDVIQAHSVARNPQIIRTNTRGVTGLTRSTDHGVDVSSISSASTWVGFLHQQLELSPGSGSGGQTPNQNVQLGDMTSQQMADPNIVVQLQQHPHHHQHPYTHAHQNQNPHVHPDPHHPNQVPGHRRHSYYRRTLHLIQEALRIGAIPLPLLGTPEANIEVRDRLSEIRFLLLRLFRRLELERYGAYEDDDNNDDEDNLEDEDEEIVIPGYPPRLIRRRDGSVWLELNDMSYEDMVRMDLAQQEEQIGNVGGGLTEEDVVQHLKRRRHPSWRMGATSSEVSPCCICQEEFDDGEEIGMLDCGHDFHSGCISRWLLEKNECPVCKSTALITGR